MGAMLNADVLLLAALAGGNSEYLAPAACAACHSQIWESYRRTGMGRSFSLPRFENNAFYHQASDQHFTFFEREGRFFQRRHQVSPQGLETSIIEKEIHFVLGSGNHARTYLHRTPDGRLLELPASWYAERGGFWAMNPGYDRPDHLGFRREIDRECLFCHGAYPERWPGPIPEGIDCQRCHGPGRAHVQAAASRKPPAAIRGAIVNPTRLTRERQLEVCLQCHLESTSHRLPYSIRRYGRDFFSYRPGEPLDQYILFFDHAQGTGHDDKFEIAHSAYRLFKSACFIKSAGALTCTTCHNPHSVQSAEGYLRACKACHTSSHNADKNCVSCHMPRRRTEDVVHVVMTDHFIQRLRPDRDLLAPLKEVHDTDQTAYRGEVRLLYPPRLPETPESELYLALAQVIEGANYAGGIPRLKKAIEIKRPAQAEFYFELANAYQRTNRAEEAVPLYREALRRQANFSAALNALGAAYLGLDKPTEALVPLRRASALDPTKTEIQVNLGTSLARTGNRRDAIDALERAIRADPFSGSAHNNLAGILEAAGDFVRAERHFRQATSSEPAYVAAHYNYGRALAARKRFEEAEPELRIALKLDPNLAEAMVSLGLTLASKGQLEAAIDQYRRALEVKPDLADARFNLALAMLRKGDDAGAKQQLESVLKSDPNDYQAHLHLGNILSREGKSESAMAHFRKASESPRPEVRAAAQAVLNGSR